MLPHDCVPTKKQTAHTRLFNSPNHNPVTGIQRAVLVDVTSQIASTELRFVTEKLTSICPEVIVNLERGIATSAIYP